MPLDLTPKTMPYYEIVDTLPNTPPGAGAKVYTALLTQTGTNAPTDTIQQDTILGTWSYIEPGKYRYTKTGTITATNTTVLVQSGAGTNTLINTDIATNYVEIQTYIFVLQAGPSLATSLENGILNETSITITVY